MSDKYPNNASLLQLDKSMCVSSFSTSNVCSWCRDTLREKVIQRLRVARQPKKGGNNAPTEMLDIASQERQQADALIQTEKAAEKTTETKATL